MNSIEFIEEVKNSNLYYPEFEEEYRSFQEYQKLALQTLNEFHSVCEKNQINYTLAYGSLIGAVRDEGQIPWDYDVDVLVDIHDRDSLIEALRRDLPDEYYFTCARSNPKCRHYILRLAPKGYNSLNLHVDVFFVIGLSEDQNEQQEMIRKLNRNTAIRRNKLRDLSREWKVNKKEFFLFLYLKLRFLFPSLKMLNKQYEEFAHRYPLKNSTSCFVPESSKVLNSDFMKTKLIELESGVYRIPVDYESILTRWYGDYRCIFPLENRLDEMRTHYISLSKFAKLL